ncbi:GNAT family N-acetyltransferase [Sphingoaurantiacus capsulatus]|uniref:GNAT family N-acetyltransferase n=1 Tax=Sphingoaurantiacus capsulatus TaxID=1771310 RepID=A0ABV7XAE8_9SPHN
MEIRDATPADIDAIRAVETAAFGQPDEPALVDRLRSDGDALVELVAVEAGAITGHILFSRLGIGATNGAALAPVAVLPDRQGRGIGGALIHAGLDRCRALTLPAVVVLGHADYYPRFGFSATLGERLTGPFSGPSFMAIELTPGGLPAGAGIRYAPAFGL